MSDTTFFFLAILACPVLLLVIGFLLAIIADRLKGIHQELMDANDERRKQP